MKIKASGPITSWHTDGETTETVTDFISLGSKITADGDCSHEIKRRLLLGRKAMTGMGEFNSDDHYIYYCGQESLRRNGVALILNARIRNAVLWCSLKNDRMISVRFQGKPFSITVIQVYDPTTNAKEAEQFYEDPQDLLELTPKKDVLFISSSVVQSYPTLQPHELQHARLPGPSPTPGACSNSCPSSWWCHPTTWSPVVPFSSCLQSFPASGSFQMSQFFASGSQSTGVSASASVLPMNIQDWLPLGLTGWISLQSKGLTIGDWNAKEGSQEISGVAAKFCLGIQNEAGQRLTVLPREWTGHSKHPLPTT